MTLKAEHASQVEKAREKLRDVIVDLTLVRDQAGRSDDARHLSVAITETENALLRVMHVVGS